MRFIFSVSIPSEILGTHSTIVAAMYAGCPIRTLNVDKV